MNNKILQQLFAFLVSLGFPSQDLEFKQTYMLSRISEREPNKTCYVNIEIEDDYIKLIVTGGYEPYVTEISKNIEELPLDFTLYMKEYINKFDGLENYKGKKTMKRRKMNEGAGAAVSFVFDPNSKDGRNIRTEADLTGEGLQIVVKDLPLASYDDIQIAENGGYITFDEQKVKEALLYTYNTYDRQNDEPEITVDDIQSIDEINPESIPNLQYSWGWSRVELPQDTVLTWGKNQPNGYLPEVEVVFTTTDGEQKWTNTVNVDGEYHVSEDVYYAYLNLDNYEDEDTYEENYKGKKTMKRRKINEEERYLSDEDIAAQYEDFKCISIEVEPSKVDDSWFNFTLELEFPDADHPDFNNYVIENGYYDSTNDVWGFDNWYPEETSEKLKEMVLAEIEKVTPQSEETDIEALQRIGSKGYAIYRNNKTGEFFIDKVGIENPKPAYKKVFGSEEELRAWAKEVGLDESYKGKKTMKKRKINEDAKIIAELGDFKPWSGAVATWEKIKDADMLEDLDILIEEMYPDGIGMTELNDLLWFEDELVLEQLGLIETEDEEEYDESLRPSRKSSRGMNEYRSSLEPQHMGYVALQGLELDDLIRLSVELLNTDRIFEETLDVLLQNSSDYAKSELGDFLIEKIADEYDEKEIIDTVIDKGFADYDDYYNDEDYDESFKPSRRRKSVNEISDELVDKVGQARAKELGNAQKAFIRKKMNVKAKSMQPGTRVIKDTNLDDLEPQRTRLQKAQSKAANHLRLQGARNRRQEESLSSQLLKSAHSVLSMNEGASDDMTTWSFKAKGLCKSALNKQSTFGAGNIRCIVHENLNGKLEGTAITDYAMPKSQVEEALKNALRQNGFRTTSISSLEVLY